MADLLDWKVDEERVIKKYIVVKIFIGVMPYTVLRVDFGIRRT